MSETAKPPIVLIHGLWLTPRSWEHFKRYYEQRGYTVHAPAWPRMPGEAEEVRRDPSALAGLSIEDILAHYQALVQGMATPPILMGHSFGGLIVQMLLDRGLGVAGVTINSAPPKGVWRIPLPVLKSCWPVLKNKENRVRTFRLSYDQFVYNFANLMNDREARAAYDRYAVPGPALPVFQAALANVAFLDATKVNFRNPTRPPLLFIAGSHDHQVTPGMIRSNCRKYRGYGGPTEYREFPLRTHLIIVQENWQDVAEYAIEWVEQHLGVGG